MFFAPVETRRCVYYPHYLHRNHPLTHDLFQSQTSPWPCSVYQTLHFFSGFIRLPRGQLKAVAKSSEFWSVPITLKGKWLEFKKLLKCLWKKSSSSSQRHEHSCQSTFIQIKGSVILKKMLTCMDWGQKRDSSPSQSCTHHGRSYTTTARKQTQARWMFPSWLP